LIQLGKRLEEVPKSCSQSPWSRGHVAEDSITHLLSQKTGLRLMYSRTVRVNKADVFNKHALANCAIMAVRLDSAVRGAVALARWVI